MIDKFIKVFKKHKFEYEVGYDWCDCNDFGDFVNVKINGKWHTLYHLNNGGYRFDNYAVDTVEELEAIINAL